KVFCKGNSEREVFVRRDCCTKPCFLPLLSQSALSLLSYKQSRFLSPASASSLAGEQGGNYRLAHTRALGHTAVCPSLGQSPNDARRAAAFRCASLASPTANNLHASFAPRQHYH